MIAYADETVIAPGLHYNVPFPEYLSWPLMSQSTLKEGRASMAHLEAARDGERVNKPTDGMLLGSALHVAFLEPELMLAKVTIWPDCVARRGNTWKQFAADNADRIILTQNMHDKLVGMVQSLRRHPRVREWAGKISHTEVAAVGTVHGVPMKARCDALTTDPLIDLKKCADADPYLFMRTAMKFGYHIQAAIYRELFGRERFTLIAVEDAAPFDVIAYELSPGFLRAGEAEAKRLLQQVAECQATGIWPGRADEIVTLELPEWAEQGSSEITIGGDAAFEE